MRMGQDFRDDKGILKDGFDYELQVWVKNYICQDVGLNKHKYAGQDIRIIKRG